MKLTSDWITGFVDGDGCFSISKIRGKTPNSKEGLRFRFIVSQDCRSADVLYALKKHFGCGVVTKAGGNMMAYSVTNRQHLRDKVIAHFTEHPLQTMKRISLYKFVTSLYDYMEKFGEIGVVPNSLSPSAAYRCNPGWFRGIVDADGCFSASIVNGRPMPRFTLGMQRGEGELIRECQRFLGCGTFHTRQDGFETLQVTNVRDMEQFLIPLFETRGSAVLLRTIKRISFQKWRKIVRLMMQGRHLDSLGMEKIKTYQAGLNKHNHSLTDGVE